MESLKMEQTEERVLAYSLATKISKEEMSQVGGGATSTRVSTSHATAGGRDQTYDSDGD